MSNLSSTKPKRVLHGKIENHDYALSEEELDSIVRGYDNGWKDYSIFSLGIGVPCLLNALSLIGQQINKYIFFCNILFGFTGFILGIIFLFCWKKDKNGLHEIITDVKSRPVIENR